MNTFLMLLFGFLGGIFGGMGMGGGTLLIPLLVIFLNMDQRFCQGINLLSFLVMSIISIFIHLKHQLIEYNVVLPFILGGMFFSILGSILVSFVPGEILRIAFGVFLCILGVYQFVKCLKKA